METHVKRVAQLEIALAMTLAMAPAIGLSQAAAAADNQRRTAIALEQQGNNAGAEAAWRVVLKAQPANSEAYAHLGFLEARHESPEIRAKEYIKYELTQPQFI